MHEAPEHPPAEPCRGPGEHHPAAPVVTDSPRVMRLAADLGSHGTTPTRESLLADFWAETEATGTPLIEPVPSAVRLASRRAEQYRKPSTDLPETSP